MLRKTADNLKMYSAKQSSSMLVLIVECRLPNVNIKSTSQVNCDTKYQAEN